MWSNVKNIVDKVAIIHDNTLYNVGNILRAPDDDKNWFDNRKRIQQSNDTILGMYFNHPLMVNTIDKPGYNPGLLKVCIIEYIKKYQPSLPEDNETCLYFRLGDINMTEFNYIDKLKQSKDVISIVCCLSFSSDKPEWRSSAKKIAKSKKILYNIVKQIYSSYPMKNIKLISNTNVDHNICYLFKNGFISDYRCTWKQIFGNFK